MGPFQVFRFTEYKIFQILSMFGHDLLHQTTAPVLLSRLLCFPTIASSYKTLPQYPITGDKHVT